MSGIGPALVMSLLVTVLGGLGTAIAFLLLRSSQPAKRLIQVTRTPAPVPEETAQPGDRAARLLLSAVRPVRIRLGLEENEKLRQKLLAAGLRKNTAVDIYFGIRLLGPVLAVLAGTFIRHNTFLWIVGMMAVTYVAPDLWVSYSVRRRREHIRTGLPDALDLTLVCVDAGLGIDQAILRAGQELAKTQHLRGVHPGQL